MCDANTYSDSLKSLEQRLVLKFMRRESADGAWAMYECTNAAMPEYGFKVHVASSLWMFQDLLTRIGPHLSVLGLNFKVPASLDVFCQINSGLLGASQVGKCMTIYTGSAEATVEAVRMLRANCRDGDAPKIPSDYYYDANESIAVRYGEISPRQVDFTFDGRGEFYQIQPEGGVFVDGRDGGLPAGIALPSIDGIEPRRVLLNDQAHRYLFGEGVEVLRTYGREGKRVYVVKHPELATKIVKQARRFMGQSPDGQSYASLLEAEHTMLSTLGAGAWPVACGFYADENNVYLVQNDLVGDACDKFSIAFVRKHILGLFAAVASLHARGVAHLDLKLANFVLNAATGAVSLIDFESASRFGEIASGPRGTRGYIAPELVSGAVVTAAMDVYSLGGVLVHLALGVCPATLPVPPAAYGDLLRINGLPDIGRLVDSMVQSDANKRPMLADIASAIDEKIFEKLGTSCIAGGSAQLVGQIDLEGVLDALESFAVHPKPGQIAWTNRHLERRVAHQGVNIGAAGIVLGVMALRGCSRRERVETLILGTSSWLAAQPAYRQAHGLFTGNAGVALALGAASLVGNSHDLRQAALDRLALSTQVEATDLFSGAAGVIFAADMLAEVGITEAIRTEVDALAQRLGDAIKNYNGILGWPEFFNRSATPSLGASHGTSGIAMALYRYGRRVSDSRLMDLAMLGFETVLANGRSEGGGHLRHDVHGKSSATSNASWCHGVAGVLWAILMSCGDDPDLREGIDWAADRFFATPIGGNPTFCHGISGQLELAILLQRVDRFHERAAERAERLRWYLLRSLQPYRSGLFWPSENPTCFTPDLWIGGLGAAVAMALHARGHPLFHAEVLGGSEGPRLSF